MTSESEAIAAERVAVTRRCIEALNGRDFDAYFACMTSDFVLRTAPNTPGGQVAVHRTDLMRFFSSFLEAWDDVRYEFVEGPSAVGERVLSKDRWTGRDHTTGSERSVEFYSVASFRGLLAERVDLFLDQHAALEFAAHDPH